MTIGEIIAARGISEVVHFTTGKGLLGILDSKAALSRPRIRKSLRLEFVAHLNTPLVKDRIWEDYVNLSITHINKSLFEISSKKWHPRLWWAVLAFDPCILQHDGVVFTTTNNIYPRVSRGDGALGLAAMFADTVAGKYLQVHKRGSNTPLNCPTDPEAEVLYPQSLSTEYLKSICVPHDELADEVSARIALVAHPPVTVQVAPERFQS